MNFIQGFAAFLMLMTSCLIPLHAADDSGSSQVKRAIRSSGLRFDDGENAIDTTTGAERYLSALGPKNQYGDVSAAGFGGYEEKEAPGEFFDKQTRDEDGGFSDPEKRKAMSKTAEGSQQRLVSKRFNEFLGKRSSAIGSNQNWDGMGSYMDRTGLLEAYADQISQYMDEKSDRDQDISPLENAEKSEILNHLIQQAYTILHSEDPSKRQYEFVGKRPYDFVGKKRYDFLGKRHQFDLIGKRYDFLGKRVPYDFLGKKSYDFLGKRYYDFLGKRAPYEFVGKRSQSPLPFIQASPALTQSAQDQSALPNKRYSDFLGKRSAESGEAAMSDASRLAALLRDNGLRKRLSRMLLNQRFAHQYPEFVG